jgi:alpha-glucosidase
MMENSPNPVALPENVVHFGHARFTIITPRLIRLEFAADRVFEDRSTLAVVNRRAEGVNFTQRIEGSTLTIDTGVCVLTYVDDQRNFSPENTSVRLALAGWESEWRPWAEEWGDLGGAPRTLDGCNGRIHRHRREDPEGHDLHIPPGLVAKRGWTLIDDSRNFLVDGWVRARPSGERTDLYLLVYGRDYKGALKDARILLGPQPLVPRFAMGYWWSRYWAYTDLELLDLVGEIEGRGLPLDVLVVDMDWHLEGWTGFSWDTRYFPDPEGFLRELRGRGIEIGMNLHPADGIGKHETAYEAMARALGVDGPVVPFEPSDERCMRAYFDHVLAPLEQQGVRFWWLDWQQGEVCGLEGLDPLTWLNHVHYHDQKERYPERRPLCFSRYGGLGGGRYPIGFSGDTYISWDSLALQPSLTANGANVSFGYWSHDIGGHYYGTLGAELFTRWVQFGVYSPILRTHAGKESGDRNFWRFPEPYGPIMERAIHTRYELIPYIETENRKGYDTGLSLCRPLFYEHPACEEGYQYSNQYYFGDAMIVAPITAPVDPVDELAPVTIWLPPGPWVDLATGALHQGDSAGVTFERRYALQEVPRFVRPGSVIPGQKGAKRASVGSYPHLLVTVVPGGDGAYTLYEDDGCSVGYQRGECGWTDLTYREREDQTTFEIAGQRGSFPGSKTNRPLEVRFFGMQPPQRVTCGGEELHYSPTGDRGWSVDRFDGDVVVRIPDYQIFEGVRITLARAPSRSFPLRGVLARLRLAFEAIRAIGPNWEREVVGIARLPERVSANPSLFERELSVLREWCAHLPRRRGELKGDIPAWRFEGEGLLPEFERAWRLLCEASRLAAVHHP